jgi:hypothetical protein
MPDIRASLGAFFIECSGGAYRFMEPIGPGALVSASGQLVDTALARKEHSGKAHSRYAAGREEKEDRIG